LCPLWSKRELQANQFTQAFLTNNLSRWLHYHANGQSKYDDATQRQQAECQWCTRHPQ
jgi:hypothetical protein